MNAIEVALAGVNVVLQILVAVFTSLGSLLGIDDFTFRIILLIFVGVLAILLILIKPSDIFIELEKLFRG
jgi:predicted membrane-bound mannosyltransferase